MSPPVVTPPASLTRRAGLTFLSSALQQGARMLVSLVATPIIVRGLGAELYGAWTMLQQATGYLALGDARPMGALKFALAAEQHLEDGAAKQRQVGAAVVIWLLGLPLLIAAGVGLVVLAPSVIKVQPAWASAVQLALGLTIATLALDRLLALPGNVLRAVNLDYRAAWLNTFAILLGGVLTVVAVRLGFGIVGLALASLGAIIVAFLPRLLIALREVPWFGIRRPGREEVGRFTRLGGWLFLLALGSLLLTATDLLVVGYILGPSAAASYAMTGAALRFCVEPIVLLVSAGNAGIAGLCGRREFGRVEQARREMLTVGLVLFIVAAMGVLILNRSFVALWVGPELYAGDLTNALLVIAALQLLFFRTDSIILDSLMAFKEKTAITVAAGIAGLCLGALLTHEYGLPGMAAGTVIGRFVLLVGVPAVVQRFTGVRATDSLKPLWRPLLAGALLFSAAILAGDAPRTTLPGFLLLGAAIVAIVGGVMLTVGIAAATRQAIFARLRAVRQRQ